VAARAGGEGVLRGRLDALGDDVQVEAARELVTAWTIATACWSPGTPRMNERSTLSTSTGNSRRRPSEEYSVPKSSIASRTPRPLSSSSTAATRSEPCIEDSVTSITSWCGGTRWRTSASASRST